MSPGTSFRGPISVRSQTNGTDVEVINATGAYVGPGTITPGDLTIPTGKTLTVTDALSLSIASKKIANTFILRLTQANYGVADGILPFACKLVTVRERHSTAESTAGSLTVMVKKVPSGTAAASGTDCLSAGINVKATADTNQSGTLHATPGNYTFAAGDSVAARLSASATELAGSNIELEFQAV